MTTAPSKYPPTDLAYLESRFWAKVDVGHPLECWEWTASVMGHGYGQTWDGITMRYTHRVAWELTHGHITDDLTVDHMCYNRRCCNPAHLQLLTRAENSKRQFHRSDGCHLGHPWTEENTLVRPCGRRLCRACRRIREKRRRER